MTDAEDRSITGRTGLAKADEVADYLNTTTNQLSRLRCEGRGPRYVKLNKSVRYRWADVLSYVEDNIQGAAGGPQ